MSQLTSKFIKDNAVTTTKINDAAVTGAKIESSVALAGSPTTTTQSANDNSTKIATTAYVDTAVSGQLQGLESQDSVLDKDLTAPPVSPTTGDRYLLGLSTVTSNMTGAWATHDGKIATYNGTGWDFTTPTPGMRTTADDEAGHFFVFGTTTWSDELFETTTASTGLTLSGNDVQMANAAVSNGISVSSGAISLELATDPGLEFNANQLQAKVDAAGALEKVTAGLDVKDGGIDAARLATDSVTTIKIAADAVDKTKIAADVAGNGLSQAVGGELDVDPATEVAGSRAAVYVGADGVGIELDNATLTHTSSTLSVKDAGITEAKLDSGIDAQTFAATHTASNYTPAQVGTEGTTKISAHLKGIDTALGAIQHTTPNKESFTLTGTDITNQYIDLANVAIASSISFLPVGGPEQQETVDYTVSLTGGAGGNTRITFAGDLATAGAAALVATDVVVIKYDYQL